MNKYLQLIALLRQSGFDIPDDISPEQLTHDFVYLYTEVERDAEALEVCMLALLSAKDEVAIHRKAVAEYKSIFTLQLAELHTLPSKILKRMLAEGKVVEAPAAFASTNALMFTVADATEQKANAVSDSPKGNFRAYVSVLDQNLKLKTFTMGKNNGPKNKR